MNKPAPILQSQVIRYAKAMQNSGIEEWRLEVKPTGEHVLIVGKQEQNPEKSDWDDI